MPLTKRQDTILAAVVTITVLLLILFLIVEVAFLTYKSQHPYITSKLINFEGYIEAKIDTQDIYPGSKIECHNGPFYGGQERYARCAIYPRQNVSPFMLICETFNATEPFKNSFCQLSK